MRYGSLYLTLAWLLPTCEYELFTRVIALMNLSFALAPASIDEIVNRRHLEAEPGLLRRTTVAGAISAIVVAGSVVIWFVTPLVERHFLAGKYPLGGALVFAARFSGVAKVMNAFARPTVPALATAGELSVVNLFGSASVAVAVVAAVIGTRWGLTGVIYGVGLGWGSCVHLLRCMAPLAISSCQNPSRSPR